MSYMWSVVSVR